MDDLFPTSISRERRDVIFGYHPFASGKIAYLPTFCANCGERGPRVPEVMIASGGDFTYFCEPCGEKYSSETGRMKVADELYFEKVSEAQLEAYGRPLEVHEILDQLTDPNSLMSKMARCRYADRSTP